MVLVFWAITPLQSAQLGTDIVRQSLDRSIHKRSSLIPLPEQEDLLGPGIMNLAYAIAWLDQPFPAFTTADAAYLPFYINETTSLTATTKTNWTAETLRLTTELGCLPAEISNNEFTPPTTLNFLNGQGCNASMALPQDQLSMFYTGFYDSPHSSFWLRDSDFCPETDNSKHQFLATWVDAKEAKEGSKKIDYNATGVYCQPKYLKQRVKLTVDAKTLTPDEASMETLSPPQALQESEFNSTAFEYLLSHGIDQELKARDYPESFVVEQHQKIAKHNISIPTSNMVPFAFAYSKRDVHEFSDPDNLVEAFEVAHKYLFSFTVSQLLTNITDFNERTADSTSFMSGIVVSRSISAALEALILLIVVSTGLMIWLCCTSSTNLDKNPSSIQRLAEICQDDPRILDMFSSTSHSNDKALSESMADSRYCLVWNESEQRPFIHVDGSDQKTRVASMSRQHGYYDPVKPLALRKESGVAFVVALLGIMGGLIYLKWAEVEYKGALFPARLVRPFTDSPQDSKNHQATKKFSRFSRILFPQCYRPSSNPSGCSSTDSSAFSSRLRTSGKARQRPIILSQRLTPRSLPNSWSGELSSLGTSYYLWFAVQSSLPMFLPSVFQQSSKKKRLRGGTLKRFLHWCRRNSTTLQSSVYTAMQLRIW